MEFIWPTDMRARFGDDIVSGTHNQHINSAYSDDALANVLDRYPRHRLGVYQFPKHNEGCVKALHGRAPDLSGEELLQAVKQNQIWLNLRAVNDVLPEYQDIASGLFSSIKTASGKSTLKQDVGLLISSPGIHVHYHLDIPMVCLIQLRGEKTIYLYPPSAPFATAEQIEAVALRERDEEVNFKHEFDTHCTSLHLSPGQMVTWPQTAPHRVQNADMMNVSLSCEFMTPEALIRANAIYANGIIRRKFGARPAFAKHMTAPVLAKAALSRLLKTVARRRAISPTPITFELHPTSLKPVPLV